MAQYVQIPAEEKNGEDSHYCNKRNCCQKIGLACEQVKSGTVIYRDYQPEKTVYDRVGFMWF
jgi:hypothetical protein